MDIRYGVNSMDREQNIKYTEAIKTLEEIKRLHDFSVYEIASLNLAIESLKEKSNDSRD